MVRSVRLPHPKHPHNCQCKTCVHCSNITDVDLPTGPPFCDPCWGHGGARAMTYKDYRDGHVTAVTSSSGSSSASDLVSRFPTHNDFFGPTLDDVFVKIYNFGRNHPPPLQDCIKLNWGHYTRNTSGGGEHDGGSPNGGGNRRSNEEGGDKGKHTPGGGEHDGGSPKGGGNRRSNEEGGDKGNQKGVKKKPKYCHGKICGKGEGDDVDGGGLGDEECDETTCGLGEDGKDGKDDAEWGLRDAFGIGIDETLLALLSQFGGWFKKRKKKKKEPEQEPGSGSGPGSGLGPEPEPEHEGESPCKCTEPPPYEPPPTAMMPFKFDKPPLDVVDWLHQEYLSLSQDMEDATVLDTPDTDGPLAPQNLKKRSVNLEALSELLTEKRGLEQGGDPAQLDHKRSRAASHYAEADINSMGVKPKVEEITDDLGKRKSVVNWEDAHNEQVMTRQSVSRQSMMGPRKSVALHPRGTQGSIYQGWTPPLHEFGHEVPEKEPHDPVAAQPSRPSLPPEQEIPTQDRDRPRSILHTQGSDTRPTRRIQMLEDGKEDHGPSRRRRSSTASRTHLSDHTPRKYKTSPDRASHDGGRRRSRSRGQTTPLYAREVPGDDDMKLCDEFTCRAKKHQSPQRPSSVVEISRKTTETYKPNRRRGLFGMFDKMMPRAFDVDVESTQTIWKSSNYDTDSNSNENRAEKPYVEMAVKGGRMRDAPCAVRASGSYKEEDIRRARVRKSQKKGKRKHEWENDWGIDAEALRRTVNTQFPSTQTVRVTAECNKETTYHSAEGCKRTGRVKTNNPPRVVAVREGEPVATGGNTLQVTIKNPGEPGVNRYVVKHSDDDVHDFEVEFQPPRKNIRNEECDEEVCRGRRRKRKRKKRGDDADDEDEEDEEDEKKSKSRGGRNRSKDDKDGERGRSKDRQGRGKTGDDDGEDRKSDENNKSKQERKNEDENREDGKNKGDDENDDGGKRKGKRKVCKCESDEDDVHQVKKGNNKKKRKKKKIVPIITKVEVLDGTKRRAILEWDDECADIPPSRPQGPRKYVQEVLWAVTRITVFGDGTRAYEVKKPTRKTPTGRIPTVTEMLFMVQAHHSAQGGVVMYDKAKMTKLKQSSAAAAGGTKPCRTEGMTKAFHKTDVDRYIVYKR